jgi:ferredoxin
MTASLPSFDVVLLLPDDEERCIQVGGEEHIWDAASKAGIVLPALCHQGRCLTCAGRLEGTGEVEQSDSIRYYPEDREAGFVLLCTGKARSSLRIRTHQQDEMRKHRKQNRLPAPYT